MINDAQETSLALALEAVVTRCRSELGDPATWLNPEGYPNGLALCVLDSVWSLGVRYESHVVPVLDRYRSMRREVGADPNLDGTPELLAVAAEHGGGAGLADVLENHQRAWTRRDAPLKAEAVVELAQALLDAGIASAEDFRRAVGADPKAVERLWRTTPGQRSSDIGWRYVQILAGADEVKPDRMVARFLSDCGGSRLTTAESAALVQAAASRLGVKARVLDHAIWRYESGRRRRGRKGAVS